MKHLVSFPSAERLHLGFILGKSDSPMLARNLQKWLEIVVFVCVLCVTLLLYPWWAGSFEPEFLSLFLCLYLPPGTRSTEKSGGKHDLKKPSPASTSRFTRLHTADSSRGKIWGRLSTGRVSNRWIVPCTTPYHIKSGSQHAEVCRKLLKIFEDGGCINEMLWFWNMIQKGYECL